MDDAEAVVVRRIFREFATGKSPRAIATNLNRDGIPGRDQPGEPGCFGARPIRRPFRARADQVPVPLAGLLVEVLVVEGEHCVRRSAQGKAELPVVAVGLALLACHEVLFSNEDGHKFPFSILTDLPGFGDLPRLTGRPESRGGG